MIRLFISYRRDDSQLVTDHIHTHMTRHFGKENVFQDVDDMPLGVDFPQYLNKQIDQCDVVLAIIGKEWQQIMQDRINQTDDFVRIEIESALRLDKLVIPVLVNNTPMPDIRVLPEEVRGICWKNAAKIRPNPDFRHDCQRLATGIRKSFESHSQNQLPTHTQTPISAYTYTFLSNQKMLWHVWLKIQA